MAILLRRGLKWAEPTTKITFSFFVFVFLSFSEPTTNQHKNSGYINKEVADTRIERSEREKEKKSQTEYNYNALSTAAVCWLLVADVCSFDALKIIFMVFNLLTASTIATTSLCDWPQAHHQWLSPYATRIIIMLFGSMCMCCVWTAI